MFVMEISQSTHNLVAYILIELLILNKASILPFQVSTHLLAIILAVAFLLNCIVAKLSIFTKTQ